MNAFAKNAGLSLIMALYATAMLVWFVAADTVETWRLVFAGVGALVFWVFVYLGVRKSRRTV